MADKRRSVARSLLSSMLGLALGVAVAVVGAEIAWAPPNPTKQCTNTNPATEPDLTTTSMAQTGTTTSELTKAPTSLRGLIPATL
jgi:hypothetical protein